MKGRFKYWLPALLWMGLIFLGSGGTLSSPNTSRFIGPILRWLAPDLSDATVRRLQVGIRKCGHFVEYALLAGLCWVGLRHPIRNDPRPWSWPVASAAFALAVLYAITDELHQSFVASRYGSPWDVMIDSIGAAAGLGLIWTWHRCRTRPSP